MSEGQNISTETNAHNDFSLKMTPTVGNRIGLNVKRLLAQRLMFNTKLEGDRIIRRSDTVFDFYTGLQMKSCDSAVLCNFVCVITCML